MSPDASEHPDTEQRRRDRVVIAAAVAALFGRSAAIRTIRAVPGRLEGAWMRAGRLALQAAHGMPAPLIRPSPGPGAGSV